MCAGLASLATPVGAATYTWLGTSGNWSDASKWSLLGVPGAGDTAIIQNGNHEVILTDARAIGSLLLHAGSLGGSGLLDAGSASFAGNGTVWLGRSDGTEGTLNVSGATTFAGGNVTRL
ncbi:MAG: hypothetical protein DI603_13330, partial [Roseateles depolymerans]